MTEKKVTLQQLNDLAIEIGAEIKNGGTILLHGDLGAGKTAFTKFLAAALGIPQQEVKSPTFAYIKSYITDGGNHFYHIDLYRAEQNDELLAQEINELTNQPKNIVVVEWPEKVDHLNFEPKFKIDFLHATLTERIVKIKKTST